MRFPVPFARLLLHRLDVFCLYDLVYDLQNRRQKEKKLPPHERVHKDLPTQQQRKSRQLSASQSAAERPAGSKKETSPALSSSDECNNSSNSLQVPSTLLPPVNLQGRHHPVPPQIHRTVSEPVSSAFLRASSAPNSRRPSTGGSDIDSEDDPQRRPRLKRSASSLSLSTDFDTGMATMRETSNDISAHMPSSSPVHQTHSVQKRSSSLAVAAPLLRRHSFTSSWSAKQSENIRPDSDMSQESPPSTSAGAGPADGDHSPGSDARSALQRKRQRMQQEHAHSEHLKHNYNLNLQIPATSPFNQSSDEPSSAASSTGGLSELLLAATTNDTTAPSSSHGSEQETDEEVSVAAKRQGGDQTFSSVDMSPDEEPDRSLEKPVSSVALTAGAGKEQKPASWSDMPRPTIIANDGKHAVKLQENESEEVDLLLSFSASFAA